MSNDMKFWLGFSTLVALIVVTLIIATTMYYRHQNEIMAEMVANGADPLRASCAMQDTYGKNPLCMVLASE